MPSSTWSLRDLFKPDEDSFGSFLVFRKLEQHIDEFHQAIKRFAEILSTGTNMPKEKAKARAAAMVMGRFQTAPLSPNRVKHREPQAITLTMKMIHMASSAPHTPIFVG